MIIHVRHNPLVEGLLMSESEEFVGRLGLADFLSDLREELGEAQSRAEGQSLRLEVAEVAVSLDVGVTVVRTGEASAGVRAKFWVLGGEAGVKGGLSSERMRTQHLTLTLKPRTEEIVVDETGQARVIRRGVDVAGEFAAGEERPALPAPEPKEQ